MYKLVVVSALKWFIFQKMGKSQGYLSVAKLLLTPTHVQHLIF